MLYSNRAAARGRAGDDEGSLADAGRVVELAPAWSRGHARRGAAAAALAAHASARAERLAHARTARDAYEHALAMAQAEAARDAAARPSASAAGEMHEGLRAALELEVALGAEDETAGACKARGDAAFREGRGTSRDGPCVLSAQGPCRTGDRASSSSGPTRARLSCFREKDKSWHH